MSSPVNEVGPRQRNSRPMHPLLKVVLIVLCSALFLSLIVWRGG